MLIYVKIIKKIKILNLCEYHRQTDRQTNTSKVKFGTSQNKTK